MPTEHKKKKMKVEPKIKAEPVELHPMEHYMDDRVELIRQIFSALKTKTIKSIAPDFLQGKTLEYLQEQCLDELLGISTKRLKSIINATKCPDNTDTSESDPEVERVDEHISLEEISSDSGGETLHKKKKAKGKKAAAKNGTVPATGDEAPSKEMSVLELLELQARARAIRSQLALEPVTKIELDADSTDSESPKTKEKMKEKPPKTTVPSAQRKPIDPVTTTNPPIPSKRVKLKRNYRKGNTDPEQNDEDKDRDKDKDKETLIDNELAGPSKNEVKEKQRSQSPDVVPIHHSPETFIIPSDSDGESTTGKYITMPVIDCTVPRPVTEDELFLRKIKESALGVKQIETEVVEDTLMESNGVPTDIPTEDGEIIDETQPKEIDTPIEKIIDDQSLGEEDEKEKEQPTEHVDESKPSSEINIIDDEVEKSNKNESQESDSSDSDSSESIKIEKETDDGESSSTSTSTSPEAVQTIEIDDDDDDIIDLGKDEDLDFETKDDEKSNRPEAENNGAEHKQPDEEQWGQRWLRGRKVSKIMATSRLANKVRSNIKSKKKQRITAETVVQSEQTSQPEPIVGPALEEGSVQHYEGLGTVKDKVTDNSNVDSNEK